MTLWVCLKVEALMEVQFARVYFLSFLTFLYKILLDMFLDLWIYVAIKANMKDMVNYETVLFYFFKKLKSNK